MSLGAAWYDHLTVTHRPRRILTVEEARNLPPPTEEQLARRRKAWEGLHALSEEILRKRGGVTLTEEEFFGILDRDPQDDEEACGG